MRSIDKTSNGLLDEKVHEGQNKISIMKRFMVLQKVYVSCCAQRLCFYALLRVYVFMSCIEFVFLCFGESHVSMIC